MKIKQTAGRKTLGEFAPKFAKLNDDVLFGDVWSGGELSLRERSVVTIVALMAQGLCDSSFRYHLDSIADGRKRGLRSTLQKTCGKSKIRLTKPSANTLTE